MGKAANETSLPVAEWCGTSNKISGILAAGDRTNFLVKIGKRFGVFGRVSKARALVSARELSYPVPHLFILDAQDELGWCLHRGLFPSASRCASQHAFVPDSGGRTRRPRWTLRQSPRTDAPPNLPGTSQKQEKSCGQ